MGSNNLYIRIFVYENLSVHIVSSCCIALYDQAVFLLLFNVEKHANLSLFLFTKRSKFVLSLIIYLSEINQDRKHALQKRNLHQRSKGHMSLAY